MEAIKDRSLAFLEGRPAEPLPSINLVSQDKKKEILGEMEEVSAIKFREMYIALNYSERLLLAMEPTSQAKFKEAGAFIKGIEVKTFKEDDKIANEDQLKELLKPMLDKKIGAQTYAELAKIATENMALFEGVAVSPQYSDQLPGRDIQVTKSTMLYLPELDIAMADLVAGKREDFVVMVVNTHQELDGSSRMHGSSSMQKSQTFIFDKKSPVDPKKLEEITDNQSVTIATVTKKVIEDWKKNQANGKEQIINELIQIQPSLIDMRATLLQMEVEQLQDALEQIKGNR